MSRLGKHTERKEDNWSVGSKEKLKASMRHKLKRTFVGCLDVIEKELGKNNELFKKMRGKILSIGNDQIRNMELELDKYNVEFIPYQIVFRQPDSDNGGKV